MKKLVSFLFILLLCSCVSEKVTEPIRVCPAMALSPQLQLDLLLIPPLNETYLLRIDGRDVAHTCSEGPACITSKEVVNGIIKYNISLERHPTAIDLQVLSEDGQVIIVDRPDLVVEEVYVQQSCSDPKPDTYFLSIQE